VKQNPLLMLMQKKPQNRTFLASGFLTENLEVISVLLERERERERETNFFTKQYTLPQIAKQTIWG
jgi:hypothetical protein